MTSKGFYFSGQGDYTCEMLVCVGERGGFSSWGRVYPLTATLQEGTGGKVARVVYSCFHQGPGCECGAGLGGPAEPPATVMGRFSLSTTICCGSVITIRGRVALYVVCRRFGGRVAIRGSPPDWTTVGWNIRRAAPRFFRLWVGQYRDIRSGVGHKKCRRRRRLRPQKFSSSRYWVWVPGGVGRGGGR